MLTALSRLVIFDWAGTMVDFGCCAPVAALVEAFARDGVRSIDAGRGARRHGQGQERPRAGPAGACRESGGVGQANGAPPDRSRRRRLLMALGPLMRKRRARARRR